MKKKYIPVTFSKDEINYFTLAIVLKVIGDVKGTESLLYFREYILGIELFIEQKYFSHYFTRRNVMIDHVQYLINYIIIKVVLSLTQQKLKNHQRFNRFVFVSIT